MKRTRKQIGSLLLSVCMVLTMLPTVAFAYDTVWDGTITEVIPVGDVYYVSNGAELAWIAQQVNENNSFLGKTIKLTGDIVLNKSAENYESWDNTPPENTWIPIGYFVNLDLNYDRPFLGTFDGQNHTISGIYINTDKTNYKGLFGYTIEPSVIQNVGVINSYIQGKNYVGGVVGYNSSGTISNCYNEGVIRGNYSVGGITSGNSGTIVDCYNTGTVSATGNAVGGICSGNYRGTISDCYNTGTVSGNSEVGGITGSNNSPAGENDTGSVVTKCFNTGTVSGAGDFVGGVVGKNYTFYTPGAAIRYCYNTGSVSGKDYVGGILGSNGEKSSILDCYNTGTVSGTSYVGGCYGASSSYNNNCFYLVPNKDGDPSKAEKLSEEMKTSQFVDGLNRVQYGGVNAFILPPSETVNNGYPILTSSAKSPIFATNLSGETSYYSKDETATALSVLANVSDSGTISYQWYKNSGIKINGETNDTYTPPTATVGTAYYYVIATNTNNSANGTKTVTTKSETKTIITNLNNVNAEIPTFNTDLSGQITYTKDAIATALTVSAITSDGGTISYQWYKNSKNNTTSGTIIYKESKATYTPPTDTVGTDYYYVIATNTNDSANGATTATARSKIKTVTINADTYAVTVNGGTASTLTAATNEVVTITAITAPSGQRFKEWTIVSGGITLANAQASSTTFTMPANAVEVTATYEDIPSSTYSITINSGTASPSTAAANEVVTITAITAPSGQRFKEWTIVSGGITLANAKASSTTFTMPANAVEVTATYENIPASDTDITAKFADANFLAEVRKALKKGEIDEIYDTDVASVKNLSIFNKGIASLAGIEYFTALTALNCDGNQLTALDVSKNTKLTQLSCNDNQLSTLDVSKNTALTYLSCNSNQLSALNVSENTELTVLDCSGNQLSALDVSNNIKLTALRCQNNQLTVLDVSNNSALTKLYCNYNQLTTLDVSNNTALTTLNCSSNYMANESAVNGLDTSRTTIFIFDPQKSSASTYAVTVNNGMASPSIAVAGATVTITANTPGNGKQFKEWTVVSGGVTLANSQESSTTFTMPANAVEVTATYEDIPAGVTQVTGVTLNKTDLSLYSNTSTKTANLTATITPADATDKSVTWQSSNTSVATADESGLVTAVGNGTATITVKTTDGGYTASCTVTVKTYTSGGGSSSGGSSPANTATIKKNQPNQPIIAVSSVTATVGTNGKASASIPDKAVTDAISKAQEEATKQKKTENGISIGLNVKMPKGATTLTATLTQNALNSLVSAGVTNLEINGSPVTISFDKKALKEIQKQTNGNVNITIAPRTNLSETAKKIIGSRPVYNINVGYGNNSAVSSFGEGGATIAIPYTPANGEVISGLYAVYVDENGNATRVEGSAYDANSGSVLFTTPHFSMYGVGYTAPSEKLTDISNHWAKESIDYVVDKGMIDGATETTFAPDTFMTRGTLVTALGRLTGKDVSSYTTSSFTDVEAGSTSQPYIEWAYKEGIIHGIGNDEFAPERAITREEIAVIIANFTNATGYTLPVVGEVTIYADASSIGDYYKTAVTAMQQAGIMTGGTGNKFYPKSNATRAEVSSMLHRYIKLIVD